MGSNKNTLQNTRSIIRCDLTRKSLYSRPVSAFLASTMVSTNWKVICLTSFCQTGVKSSIIVKTQQIEWNNAIITPCGIDLQRLCMLLIHLHVFIHWWDLFKKLRWNLAFFPSDFSQSKRRWSPRFFFTLNSTFHGFVFHWLLSIILRQRRQRENKGSGFLNSFLIISDCSTS